MAALRRLGGDREGQRVLAAASSLRCCPVGRHGRSCRGLETREEVACQRRDAGDEAEHRSRREAAHSLDYSAEERAAAWASHPAQAGETTWQLASHRRAISCQEVWERPEQAAHQRQSTRCAALLSCLAAVSGSHCSQVGRGRSFRPVDASEAPTIPDGAAG